MQNRLFILSAPASLEGIEWGLTESGAGEDDPSRESSPFDEMLRNPEEYRNVKYSRGSASDHSLEKDELPDL